jgi:hypothetical protein
MRAEQVDCAACHHVAMVTPEALLRLGLNPAAKVPDLKERFWCVFQRGRFTPVLVPGLREEGASCRIGFSEDSAQEETRFEPLVPGENVT